MVGRRFGWARGSARGGAGRSPVALGPAVALPLYFAAGKRLLCFSSGIGAVQSQAAHLEGRGTRADAQLREVGPPSNAD